jgi:hypothetical protein
MSEKQHPAKSAFQFGLDQLFSYLFSWAIGLPIVAAAITAASSFMQHQPLWVIIPATGLSAMTVMMAVNHVDQFVQRRSSKSKVRFNGMKIDTAIDPITRESGYTVSILIENISDLALEYQATAWEATIGDIKSREGPLPTKKFGLQPKHTATFKSGLIPGMRLNATLVCKIRTTMRYGRASGPLRHQLTEDFTLIFETDEKGNFQNGALYDGDEKKDEEIIRALRSTIAVQPSTSAQ